MENIKEDIDAYAWIKSKIVFGKSNNIPYLILFSKDSPKLIIEFQKESDYYEVISSFNKTIDVKSYWIFLKPFLKWRQIKDSFKIIDKGECSAKKQDEFTYIIKTIKNLKKIKNNSNLVIRFDYYGKGTESKITNEPPNKYNYFLRLKEMTDSELKIYAWIGFIGTIVISLLLTFLMTMGLMKSSRREKNLENKLSKIIKENIKIFLIKDPIPNAFCIIKPVIFITESLVDILNEREIIAVLIHEYAHIKNKDVIKTMMATNGFIALLLVVLTAISGPALSIVSVLYFVCRNVGVDRIIFGKTYGRKFEKRSDALTVKYGYGQDIISALTKLEGYIGKIEAKRPCGTMCNLEKKLGAWIDEHPSLKERIENVLKNEKDVEMLMGDASYSEKASHLKSRLLGE
jgi:hypothetical protein